MRRFLILFILTISLFGEDIYATFNVEAKKSANLAFNAGGIIKKVYVDVGSFVKKGDVIAVLNNSDIKAALNLNKVELKYAKKDYSRALRVKSVMDKAAFDKFAFKKDIAAAKIKIEQERLSKTALKAPFTGVIYYKNIEAGDVVTAMNPKTIFKIQSPKERVLKIFVDQRYANSIKVGDEFVYKIDGTKEQKVAKISKIYPTIDTKSRKITAEAKAQSLIVGSFGDGYIRSSK
jgi:RND family efflux transporter MFP subunit